MPFRQLLAEFYYTQVEDNILYDGMEGYRQDNTIFFIIPAEHKEAQFMEQTVIAHYLQENGYRHLAVPMQNKDHEWFTTWNEERYIVLRTEEVQTDKILSPGESLAYFHELGTLYPYEPKEISSYGQWKDLWIYKLTAYEERVIEQERNRPSRQERSLIDVFPYLIGLSENAIQYVQETNEERRFHEGDQGTIAFHRYKDQLEQPIVWSSELWFDHPARDIAEALRTLFLADAEEAEIIRFLRDYESVRPLSIFSWRLIYSRLIFPAHLFDALDRTYQHEDEGAIEAFMNLMEKQTDYEEKLRYFFHYSGIDAEELGLPVLDWLY